MKKYITFAAFVAALITAGLSSAQQRAQPALTPLPYQPPPTDKSLTWQGGRSVTLCDAKGNACTLRPLPAPAGTPAAITKGTFVDSKLAQSSWLVTSDKRYSLCLYTTPKT